LETSLESQLRLILSNRRVAWFAGALPEACSIASRLSWHNEFFPKDIYGKWSRIVIFGHSDLAEALSCLAPGGCIVLVEDLDQAIALDKLTQVLVHRVETCDGFAFTVLSEALADRAAGPVGTRAVSRPPRVMASWRKKLRRRWIATKRFGPIGRRAISKFLGDLKVLDAAMAPFAEHYAAQLPDPAEGFDAALHYFMRGARLGLNPTPHFSTNHYVATYPDVVAADFNPFLHYVRHGQSEGRLAMPLTLEAAKIPRKPASPVTGFVRIPPEADIFALVGADPMYIEWERIVAGGPCSLVLLGTNPLATTRWLRTGPDPASVPGLELLSVTPYRSKIVPAGWRQIVCNSHDDLVETGARHAIHDRVILCADCILPMPGALAKLADQIGSSDLPVTGRIINSSGIMVAMEWNDNADEMRYEMLGNWASPRWFQCDQKIGASPHFVAGTREILKNSAKSWQCSEKATAILEPRSVACLSSEHARKVTGSFAKLSVIGNAAENPAKFLSVKINNWVEATADHSFALHAFLLDAVSAFGPIDLHCQTQHLPLSDLAWLGAHGVRYMVQEAKSDARFSNEANSIAVEVLASGSAMSIAPSSATKCMSLERLDLFYSDHYCDVDICGAYQCADEGNQNIVCLCPDSNAAVAMANWIAKQLSTHSPRRKFLVVGAAAAEVLTASVKFSRTSVVIVPEYDWLRFIDWANAIATVDKTHTPGTVLTYRINIGRDRNHVRDHAAAATKRISALMTDI